MTIIQVLLLAVSVLLLFYFARLRSRARDKLVVTLAITAAFVLILFPGLTTRIANMVGVGRGTDLMLYIGFVMAAFASLLFYSKTRELEARLTTLARSIAIQQANTPCEHEGEVPDTLDKTDSEADDVSAVTIDK
ncbi:MAG: DUF2304 domain-containing protein [Chloroflexi bacterium]|nr:DUF2304 domain-containing protein [Chloroflexota bacterium]